MQFILPIELKLLGVNKLYSPMNFIPVISKFLKIKTILCLHSNLPWCYFNLMPGNFIRNFITKKLMEISIYSSDLLIVNSNFAKKEITKTLAPATECFGMALELAEQALRLMAMEKEIQLFRSGEKWPSLLKPPRPNLQ
jgi:hypothetical protein